MGLSGLASDYSNRTTVGVFDIAYVRCTTNSNRAAGDVVRRTMLLWPKSGSGEAGDESS
jgi:hypothetical protein